MISIKETLELEIEMLEHALSIAKMHHNIETYKKALEKIIEDRKRDK